MMETSVRQNRRQLSELTSIVSFACRTRCEQNTLFVVKYLLHVHPSTVCTAQTVRIMVGNTQSSLLILNAKLNLPDPFGPMIAVKRLNGPSLWRPRYDLKLSTSMYFK